MKNLQKFNETIFIYLYSFFWIVLLPFIIFYFLKRSIKETEYRKNLRERFGFYKTSLDKSIWIHTASLGEFRAAAPFIKKLLKKNEKIIVTTLTPAGRLEIKKIFKEDILKNNLVVVYLPFEISLCIKSFFLKFRPKLGIILEIELWPKIISSSQLYNVPIILAQAQYPKKSFERDKKYFRSRASIIKKFDLILTKSKKHSNRFEYFGGKNIKVMGEFRFDQLIPKKHLEAAKNLKKIIKFKNPNKKIICFGSTGPNEDLLLIKVIKDIILYQKNNNLIIPFFVYVPRHKKDFIYIEKLIKENNLKFINRNKSLDENLKFTDKKSSISCFDGLFGNSLGEINFYYELSDFIFIGNSFNNLGSHNIIEPLALKKNVVVGPSIWGIEYPGVEAIESNVLKKVNNEKELKDYWLGYLNNTNQNYLNSKKIDKFYNQHSGATERCIKYLRRYGFL